jgi:putative ABC transport system substrate-binding protein
MKLHGFLALLALATLASPCPAAAQSPAVPVMGFLNIGSSRQFAPFLKAFHNGLEAAGFAEGRNLAIEYRWAEGNYDLVREQAADLVRRRVVLIVATGGTGTALAAKNATGSIPVLFLAGADPVAEGLVASFNRPGGNVTGVTLYTSALVSKRLEKLRDLLPGAATMAFLVNPKTVTAAGETEDVEKAARAAGLKVLVIDASAEDDLRAAFASATQNGIAAMLVSADPFFTRKRAQIVGLAAEHRLPVAYPWRQYVAAGGLMSYGPSISGAYCQIGDYAGRILKGAKPEELPVQIPTRFELVINLTTAKALGLEVPIPLQVTADEVIGEERDPSGDREAAGPGDSRTAARQHPCEAR